MAMSWVYGYHTYTIKHLGDTRVRKESPLCCSLQAALSSSQAATIPEFQSREGAEPLSPGFLGIWRSIFVGYLELACRTPPFPWQLECFKAEGRWVGRGTAEPQSCSALHMPLHTVSTPLLLGKLWRARTCYQPLAEDAAAAL